MCPGDEALAQAASAATMYITPDQCNMWSELMDLSDEKVWETYCLAYPECWEQCQGFDIMAAYTEMFGNDYSVRCDDWSSPCDDVDDGYVCSTFYQVQDFAYDLDG